MEKKVILKDIVGQKPLLLGEWSYNKVDENKVRSYFNSKFKDSSIVSQVLKHGHIVYGYLENGRWVLVVSTNGPDVFTGSGREDQVFVFFDDFFTDYRFRHLDLSVDVDFVDFIVASSVRPATMLLGYVYSADSKRRDVFTLSDNDNVLQRSYKYEESSKRLFSLFDDSGSFQTLPSVMGAVLWFLLAFLLFSCFMFYFAPGGTSAFVDAMSGMSQGFIITMVLLFIIMVIGLSTLIRFVVKFCFLILKQCISVFWWVFKRIKQRKNK